jgi:hypothetical protein
VLKKYFKKRTKVENELTPKGFLSILDTKEEDVFIAAYPKSGNTWMQNIVTGLILDSNSSNLTPQLVNEVVPDVHAKKYYKRLFPEMVFKTHGLPTPRYKRVIHLVRDGRDAMVSYYNMGKNKSKNFPYSMKDMVIHGKGVSPTKWHIHCQQWFENPYNAEIVLIKYENLHLNPKSELRKICDFLALDISEERMMLVFENNSIDHVRTRVGKFGMDNDHTWENKSITSFFRKGIVGGYKEEMPEDLIVYFNAESKDQLLQLEYDL